MPAPADAASVQAALSRLKIAPLLGAYRGRAALDVPALVNVAVRLGWLAAEIAQQPGVQTLEIEVNPLKLRLAGLGATAVDARALGGRADQA